LNYVRSIAVEEVVNDRCEETSTSCCKIIDIAEEAQEEAEQTTVISGFCLID